MHGETNELRHRTEWEELWEVIRRRGLVPIKGSVDSQQEESTFGLCRLRVGLYRYTERGLYTWTLACPTEGKAVGLEAAIVLVNLKPGLQKAVQEGHLLNVERVSVVQL